MLKKTKRPEDWGQREKHPLYNLWHWNKNRNRYGVVPEWAEDFWAFVEGVGEKPGPAYRLRRHVIDQAMGPDNFFWEEKYAKGDGNAMTRAERAAYMREYRKRRPRNVRNTMLKRNYGITLQQWEALYEAQGGKCAICQRAENAERYANLAVDHCHDTGKVRGLLCNNCNRALGMLDHDPDRLRNAAAFLERNS